ncbi:MAG: hypothetical protein ABIJ84_00210 [bacterium]
MKSKIFLFFAFILLSISIAGFAFAETDNKIEINFFYSATCPHCIKEKEFLKGLKEEYPELEIKEYEVVSSPENKKVLSDFYNKYHVPKNEQGRVPVTFTSKKYFIGFSDQIGEEIKGCINQCLGDDSSVVQKIKIPFLNEIDVSRISLPLLTVILGLLDGFNPCAMWVLVILISLLLPLKSRKKIALVGGIFILAEGLLYFLFMTAWLNAFFLMGYVSLVRIFIGIFGIAFGFWRIKEFLTWKPGVCKVVDSSGSREKLLGRMKNVLKPTALPATILGVIVLAFSVNLVEFFCSAGFPVIYTKVLALQSIETWQYYLYIFFYNIFYMLDDFIVFGFAFFTLSYFNFSEKYNRYSTLVAGILILLLGVFLLFRPEWLMFG